MERIKLSIIVPVYNVERYIKKCIDSLLVEGCENYEIIVVNDGTKDRSIEVVKESFSDLRIRIIEQENGGLSAARNYGIANARGEYVWCFDSDDWAETNCIPHLISKLEGIDLLYFNCYYRNYENNHSQELKKLDNEAKTGMELACKGFWHPTQFYIIRKEFLETHNLYYTEGILHEDSLFTPIMITHCNKVLRYEHPVYHHLQRSGSITQTVSPKRIYDMIFVIKTLVAFGETLPEVVRWQWGRCIVQITNSVLICSKECEDKAAKQSLKKYVNHNKAVIEYLAHSGRNNRIMSRLATLMGGRLYEIHNFLYRLKGKKY